MTPALRYLGYAFVLPNALVNLIVILVFYRPQSWHLSGGCLEVVCGQVHDGGRARTRIWGRPAAQSFGGPVIAYAAESWRRNAGLHVHERVHILQAMVCNAVAVPGAIALGYHVAWPLAGVWALAFALAYGLDFARLYVVGPLPQKLRADEPRWQRAYRTIWAEKMAYRVQKKFQDGALPDAWGA